MRGGLELRGSHGKSALLCVTALLFLVVVSVRADIHPVPLEKNADSAKCLECHNSDDNREFGGAGANGPHGSTEPKFWSGIISSARQQPRVAQLRIPIRIQMSVPRVRTPCARSATI
jgi:hypothetical protein